MSEKTEFNCIRGDADIDLINRSILEISAVKQQIEKTSKVLTLLGNSTRLKIVYLIKKEEKICVCDLSDILEISVSAISQQLRKLKDGGLLKSIKKGQIIYYKIEPKYEETIHFILKKMILN